MSSGSGWPELESTISSKAPEWSLRTESELHVDRLEAKLDSIKRNSRPSKQPHQDAPQTPQEVIDSGAEEIQSGQEEADEGLWLLWNNKNDDTNDRNNSSSSIRTGPAKASGSIYQPSAPSTTLLGHASQQQNRKSYGSNDVQGSRFSDGEGEDGSGEQEHVDEEREERLEMAKAKAKHVDEYVVQDWPCSRTCCCVIS